LSGPEIFCRRLAGPMLEYPILILLLVVLTLFFGAALLMVLSANRD